MRNDGTNVSMSPAELEHVLDCFNRDDQAGLDRFRIEGRKFLTSPVSTVGKTVNLLTECVSMPLAEFEVIELGFDKCEHYDDEYGLVCNECGFLKATGHSGSCGVGKARKTLDGIRQTLDTNKAAAEPTFHPQPDEGGHGFVD